MMKRCAFLSTEDLTGHVTDDHLSAEPFRERGWEVEPASWRSRTDWGRFDAVVIRTPWDYQDDPDAFLTVLEEIDRTGTPLANPLSLVRWNVNKKYLLDLERVGVRVVPTIYECGWSAESLRKAFDKFSNGEVVVKPVIGASAGDIWRLRRDSVEGVESELERVFLDRDLMIQPFVPAIVDEGEFSLFYFGAHFSHAVIKTPKPQDFRVQEEHGGRIMPVVPSPECTEMSEEILRCLGAMPLYARVDLVRDTDGAFMLMELELIEPALYLRTDPLSAERFAAAFEEWIDSVEKRT